MQVLFHVLRVRGTNPRNRGFTLIELLVVIAIIGILSAVVLASLNSARERAQASRMVTDFKQIELAFQMYGLAEGVFDWWTDTELGSPSGGSVDISTLSADTAEFGRYLAQAPVPPVGSKYSYDNDGDVSLGCDTSYSKGVNILVGGISESVFTTIDKTIDKSDGALCGKIMWNGSTLSYKMSLTQGL